MGSTIQQIPLGFGVFRLTTVMPSSAVTLTKISLLRGNAVRSSSAAVIIFGGVKGFDIRKEIIGLFGIRRSDNNFPHMV